MAKKDISPIVGNRVRLRLLTESDLPVTRSWRNQDHIRKWFLTSKEINSEEHHAWFLNYKDRDDDFVFIIEEAETCRAIGQISLYNIDWRCRQAEYGRLMIGETDVVGKGFAHEASVLLVDYAFKQFGLNEIILEVFASNTHAIAIYNKCGFKVVDHYENILKMSKRVKEGLD